MHLSGQTDLHIPTSLIQRVVELHFFFQFQLYLFLKTNASGKIKLDTSRLNLIASDLSIKSKSTIHARIRTLCDRNWIGFNSNSGIYFIRGFNNVCKIEGLNPKYAVVYFEDYSINFLGFLGAVIFMNFYKAVKRRLQNGAVSIKGETNQSHKAAPLYLPVSITGVANSLYISRTLVHRLKSHAVKAELLFVKQRYTKLQFNSVNAFVIQRYLPNTFKKNGEFFLREVDSVYPILKTSLRRF